jgi:F-type H+-transporting ATPase subunit delta
MSAARVAVRYARALVEALAEKDALDRADTLLSFCALVAGNEELTRVFGNVTIPVKTKAAVTQALAEKLALPEMIGSFLRITAENGRLGILDEIGRATSAALDEKRNIRAVRLTTATEATTDELARFEAAMKQVLGSEVRIDADADQSILGGAIAQVGSFVYDGSVAAQLTRLRRQLIEER